MQAQPNALKAIRIMYFAMLAGQVMFALIATVLIETGALSIKNDSLMPLIQIVAIVIAAVSISASFFVFRNRISDIQPQEEGGKKMEKYRAALILRMALCEMPTLFATIAYFLTGDRFFLWMIIVLIGIFLYFYPARDKIINLLQLNSEEQSALGFTDRIP